MYRKRIELLSSKLTHIFMFLIVFTIGRNIVISHTGLNLPESMQNLATFTGAQTSKVTLFSLGITPYMLAITIVNIMKSNLVPHVKELMISSPNFEKNAFKVLFLFYAVFETFFLYSDLLWYQKIILIAGAYMIRFLCDLISAERILSGISAILCVSIFGELISISLKEWMVYIPCLFIFILIAIIYQSKSEKFYLLDTENSIGYDVNLSTSLIGVMPLFYSSLLASVADYLVGYFKINLSYISIVVMIISIFIFTYTGYKKIVKSKEYSEMAILKGYLPVKNVNKEDYDLNNIQKMIDKKVLFVSFKTGLALNIFGILPGIISILFKVKFELPMISVILLVSILAEMLNTIKNFSPNINYHSLY